MKLKLLLLKPRIGKSGLLRRFELHAQVLQIGDDRLRGVAVLDVVSRAVAAAPERRSSRSNVTKLSSVGVGRRMHLPAQPGVDRETAG